MSARISVEGDAIDVSGRFTSEAAIDAFVDRLWRVWFAVHDEQDERSRNDEPATLPRQPNAQDAPKSFVAYGDGVVSGRGAAIHEDNTQRLGVDARHKAGHDAERESPPAVMAGLDPAIHEGNALKPGVDFRHDAPTADAPRDDAAIDPAAAFARLTPTQRRAVLLKRKLVAVAKVAKEMGVTETTVYLHLKAAREKGVAI